MYVISDIIQLAASFVSIYNLILVKAFNLNKHLSEMAIRWSYPRKLQAISTW